MVTIPLLVASALAWAGEPRAEILDFTATWCGPCQRISPLVSKLQRTGVPIRKVDADANRDVFQKYGVRTMPTFILVVDGEEVSRSRSENGHEPELRRLCAMLRATEEPPVELPKTLVVEKGVKLGSESPLPKSNTPAGRDAEPVLEKTTERVAAAPPAPVPEKPGVFDRLLGRKPAQAAAAVPTDVRAQGDDPLRANESQAPATPLAATVRLRVRDSEGESFGTGTIIDSRPGRTLILTCGHLFRQWKKGSRVHVDLFRGDKVVATIVGSDVRYELDERAGIDIALVSIPTDQPLPARPVASAGTRIRAGARVASVGCGGGDPPTVQVQKITALNRYKGADNIECSTMPVVGRSGGGLFDENGNVIGVCMCEDRHYREGLYAGLNTIRGFLTRQNLGALCGPEETEEESPVLVSSEAPTSVPQPDEVEPAERRVATVREKNLKRDLETADTFDRDVPQPSVSREDVVGSEVVIIIHPTDKSGGPSKVLRLNRASQGFWEHLLPELEPKEQLLETSLQKKAAKAPVVAATAPVGRQVRKPATSAQEAASPTLADSPAPYRRKR